MDAGLHHASWFSSASSHPIRTMCFQPNMVGKPRDRHAMDVTLQNSSLLGLKLHTYATDDSQPVPSIRGSSLYSLS